MSVSSWVIEKQADGAFLATESVSGQVAWDSTLDGLLSRLPRPCNVKVGGAWLRVPVDGEVYEVSSPVLVDRYKAVHERLVRRVSGGKIRRLPRMWLKKDAELLRVAAGEDVVGVIPGGVRERCQVENRDNVDLAVRAESVKRKILHVTRFVSRAVLPVVPPVAPPVVPPPVPVIRGHFSGSQEEI